MFKKTWFWFQGEIDTLDFDDKPTSKNKENNKWVFIFVIIKMLEEIIQIIDEVTYFVPQSFISLIVFKTK